MIGVGIGEHPRFEHEDGGVGVTHQGLQQTMFDLVGTQRFAVHDTPIGRCGPVIRTGKQFPAVSAGLGESPLVPWPEMVPSPIETQRYAVASGTPRPGVVVDGHQTDEQSNNQASDPSGGAAPQVEADRRQSPRIKVTLDATYKRLGRDADPASAATVDVSHGGARITAPRQVAVGDVIQLTVAMPHGIELTLQGLVVQLSNSDASHHAHVAFDSLSTAAADLLTEILDEHLDLG